MKLLRVIVGVLLASAPGALAQDTHYWSIQYGPTGQLLGGQVIGGTPDLSATFYNPGSLALRNESSYLLSTESVQYESVSTSPQGGQRLFTTSSSNFGTAPSLLAGALPEWLGPETVLAWSFLIRQNLDVRLGQRLTDPVPAPYVKSAAESYIDQEVSESWGGLTVSRRLSDSVGLGLTWYGVYRGQRTRNELSVQAIAETASPLALSGVTDFEYSHYRTLAKLGLAWEGRDWKAGLSITTPSLGVMGSAKSAYTLSLAGLDDDGNGRPDSPVLVTSTNEDLDADYHSPWAVGIGLSRKFGRTRLHASGEWFAAVDPFTVVAAPVDASGLGPGLNQELRSVINGGLAAEYEVSPDVSVYGAFHTDFTAATGDARADVAVSDWNIYHLSGGVSFYFGENRFTLGLLGALGSKTRQLDVAVAGVPGVVGDTPVEISYSRITFLLGFTFGK